MKYSRQTLIRIAGCVWLLIGLQLLTMGILFLFRPVTVITSSKFSLLNSLSFLTTNRQNGLLILLVLGLFVGRLKGKFMLGKSVKRQVSRISALKEPVSLRHLYSKGYYLLIGSMIALGVSLRYLPITLDTRGTIDVAIGAALIHGALHYFRFKLAKEVA